MRCKFAGVFTVCVAVLAVCQCYPGSARTLNGRVIDDAHVRLLRPGTAILYRTQLQIRETDVDPGAYDLDLQQQGARHAASAFLDDMRFGWGRAANSIQAAERAAENAIRAAESADESAMYAGATAAENHTRGADGLPENQMRTGVEEGELRGAATEDEQRVADNTMQSENTMQFKGVMQDGVFAPAGTSLIMVRPGVPKNDPSCNCTGAVIVHIADCCIKAGKNNLNPLCGVPHRELSGNLADEWHSWEENAGKQLSAQDQKIAPGIYLVNAAGHSASGFSTLPFPSGSVALLCHVTVSCATEDKKF